MSENESFDVASEIATTIKDFSTEESKAENVENKEANQENTNTQQTEQTQTPSILDFFDDYKDYLLHLKNNYSIDELQFLKDLIRTQQIYEQNPKAFTIALIQKHLPELIDKLTQSTPQTNTVSDSTQNAPDFDELDEEDRKLYETLNQIQAKLSQFDQFYQAFQQQALEQQTQAYLNTLNKLAEEMPLLRNPNLAPKIGQLTEQLLASGLEKDFEQAVRKAYKALAPDTQPSVAKPLKNVSESSDLIDIKEDEPINQTVKKIFNAFKGYQSF